MNRRVHFIGIGGSGLSAIATVLMERGELVSGSDRQESPVTTRLQQAGMTIMIGHRPENVAGVNGEVSLVIRSSAISPENIEVQAAIAAGIPVLKREDFLGQLIGQQKAIAVAGTHGKTTTTALIAWLLTALGQDPSYVIGGQALNMGKNAHAGSGEFFVIEADEYDRMFLGLQPWIAVVTNIEHDHPDCYPTAAEFQSAFEAFADRLCPGGILLANADDPGARLLIEKTRSNAKLVFTYSLYDQRAEYFAADLRPNSLGGNQFELVRQGASTGMTVQLSIPGVHNVSNSLAALAVIDLLGLPLEQAAKACEAFQGTGRRFEQRGEAAGVTLIDDYAHHPTEIRATLAAARARYPSRRIWAVWQPHTYSRTRTLIDSFSQAFQDADCVVVTDIFAAREPAPQDGFSGEVVAEKILQQRSSPNQAVIYEPDLMKAASRLAGSVKPGDVVLVLSAGDADQISARLLAELQEKGMESPDLP